ncbi:hypothetical protein M8C21_031113 [Ambrosia artemisiifolia]|uniref:Uncharacterized protein n=1 Tax=Ambrosia artemisiifolia TaxID=4212 RepID=A0AAD5GG83_AMBAR|nr:hypothetical protein M8C21_031113 [Ambrosia artemisiifolia]
MSTTTAQPAYEAILVNIVRCEALSSLEKLPT